MDGAQHRFEGGTTGTLVVALTSYGSDNAPAQGFEWIGALEPFDCHKLFLRDENQHWYLGGVPGFSTSVQDTAVKVRAFMADHGLTRLVTIGSSMGGFGALSLGAEAKADRMLAFGANTMVEQSWWMAETDHRGWPKIYELNWHGYDGRDLACQPASALSGASIYFDPAHNFDYLHGHRLSVRGDVETVHLNGAGHAVCAFLHKARRLRPLLISAIAPDGPEGFVLRRSANLLKHWSAPRAPSWPPTYRPETIAEWWPPPRSSSQVNDHAGETMVGDVGFEPTTR